MKKVLTRPKFANRKFRAGFTIIETLVAISILLVMLTGPMEIASKGLFSAIYAKDEITAYFLAQEGIELVKNIRDTNYLKDVGTNNTEWLEDLVNCIEEVPGFLGPGCYVDGTQPDPSASIGQCHALSCPPMYYHAGGIYNYTQAGGTKSKFKRSIILTQSDDGDINKTEIISIVEWQSNGITNTFRNVTLRSWMFNWQRQ